ncbi:unnamed protein product [Leuciscus chuanchicus]
MTVRTLHTGISRVLNIAQVAPPPFAPDPRKEKTVWQRLVDDATLAQLLNARSSMGPPVSYPESSFHPLDEACELVSFGTTEEYDVDKDAMSTPASGSGDWSCRKSEAPSGEVPPTDSVATIFGGAALPQRSRSSSSRQPYAASSSGLKKDPESAVKPKSRYFRRQEPHQSKPANAVLRWNVSPVEADDEPPEQKSLSYYVAPISFLAGYSSQDSSAGAFTNPTDSPERCEQMSKTSGQTRDTPDLKHTRCASRTGAGGRMRRR